MTEPIVKEMIFYGLLLFYVLLLIFSLLFFFVEKSDFNPFQIAFAIQQKKSFKFFFPGKVRISRYITLYECPECGYKSMEKSKNCPHCKIEGKETPLVAKTIPFKGGFQ